MYFKKCLINLGCFRTWSFSGVPWSSWLLLLSELYRFLVRDVHLFIVILTASKLSLMSLPELSGITYVWSLYKNTVTLPEGDLSLFWLNTFIFWTGLHLTFFFGLYSRRTWQQQNKRYLQRWMCDVVQEYGYSIAKIYIFV